MDRKSPIGINGRMKYADPLEQTAYAQGYADGYALKIPYASSMPNAYSKGYWEGCAVRNAEMEEKQKVYLNDTYNQD